MAASPIIPTAKITPELKAIARELKTLTQAYAPVKTGNLRKTIGDYNTDANMITIDNNGKTKVSIDYGPPGAEYGQYWNPPFTKKSTTKNRPEFGFADKAVGDPKVEDLIDKYIQSLANSVGDMIENNIGTKK
jgi:hypothetical protein